MIRYAKLSQFSVLFLIYAAHSFYVYTDGTSSSNSIDFKDDIHAGFEVFQKYNCIACHQFYGLGGYMGPDLTNIISDPDKGPEYARFFIEFGTDMMPDFNLSEEEIDHLIQLLTFVDSSGRFPIRDPKVSWYGTVRNESASDVK